MVDKLSIHCRGGRGVFRCTRKQKRNYYNYCYHHQHHQNHHYYCYWILRRKETFEITKVQIERVALIEPRLF